MWPLNLLPAGADGQPALLFHAPLGRARGLLICVHGYTRQPLDQAEVFLPLAAARGWAVVLPVFDEHRHRRYAVLRAGRRGLRADLGLIDRIEALALTHGLPRRGWHLFGHSAGAQFAHRFAMLHPQRLRALALGAAGWYTWPDATRAWPFGTAGVPQPGGVDLPAFLNLPLSIWVGERDDGPDRHLRDEPALSDWQGHGRLERARRWREALAQAAAAHGQSADVPLTVVPGAGHSFVSCHRRGRMADAVIAFFDRATVSGAADPAADLGTDPAEPAGFSPPPCPSGPAPRALGRLAGDGQPCGCTSNATSSRDTML